MTDEVEPRIWMGDLIRSTTWRWVNGGWHIYSERKMAPTDIFVPGNQPKPTIDPAGMESIRTCKVVDWT